LQQGCEQPEQGEEWFHAADSLIAQRRLVRVESIWSAVVITLLFIS
jgi:hypothetical protein